LTAMLELLVGSRFFVKKTCRLIPTGCAGEEMSLIGLMLKYCSWCRQGLRILRRREIEVLRDTVDSLREQPPIRAGDVLFGMLLGTVLCGALWFLGSLIWHAIRQ
jgi:hypothetical protein